MRQFRLVCAAGLFFLVQIASVPAQNAVDILDKDLDAAKEQHKEALSQNFTDFINQLTAAMASSDAAMNLYQSSGGNLPPATAVQTKYAHETPHEKADRDARDAAQVINLALVAQIHCGMMRYAAVYVTTPDQKGLREDWDNWLKSAPQIYVQVKDDGLKQVKELKAMTMRDSPIAANLGFHSWGDKEQGQWTVKELPKLYRTEILEPLRAKPSPETLAAWDVYIQLKNVDQPDNDKWDHVDYPYLSFDRGCDDYAITPSTEKLQFLVELIKANPTHPKLDDMIARTHDLLQDYRTRHPGAAAAQVPAETNAAPSNPNVTVTTTTSGDMTVVTTHTNAPPSNPAP